MVIIEFIQTNNKLLNIYLFYVSCSFTELIANSSLINLNHHNVQINTFS